MIGRKIVLWYFFIKNILKPIQKLRIFILIVILTAIQYYEHRPSKSANKRKNTQSSIDTLTPIAIFRISEIIELYEAKPNSRQKLISPYLIYEIY